MPIDFIADGVSQGRGPDGVDQSQPDFISIGKLQGCGDCLGVSQGLSRPSGNIATAVYLEALCQHALGQNESAIAAVHRFVRAYPNHPQVFDATLLEGQCLESMGNLKDALAVYEKMAADAPASAKPAAYYAIGMACEQAGRYPAAADTFALIVRDYPRSAYAGMARLQAAIVQLRAGDSAGARDSLMAIKQEDAGRAATASYWLARCDMADKKYGAARTALAQLLIAAPAIAEKPEILFDMAACDLALRDYQKAVDGFAHFRDAYLQEIRLTPGRIVSAGGGACMIWENSRRIWHYAINCTA